MKPFNLEECIAGKRVVTRDGREYKFGAYNPDANNYQLAGWINGDVNSHTAKGKYYCNGEYANSDLFMWEEPKVKREGWINIYKEKNHNYTYHAKIYESKSEAIHMRVIMNCVDTIKIEWYE